MKLTFRSKLVLSFLVVVLFTGFIGTLVGERLISGGIIQQAQEKVRVDLNSAREIYQSQLDQVKDVVRFTADRFFINSSLLSKEIELNKDELKNIRARENLDIFTVSDKNGNVIFRTRNPTVFGDSQAQDEVVSFVISKNEIIASTVIISREELLKEGDDLAERAHINIIHTPRAKPRPESEELSGMMIKAAAPILNHDGNLLGVLYGGRLLNRNYDIVDKVKETVYQGQVYEGKDIGTATIFQGDLRISTNVKREDGSRAIGTRVSEEVYDQVLVKGLPWIERAFVVNDWYYTAYEPIKNIRGDIIGILYVGILEEKFVDLRWRTLWLFLGITFVGIIIAATISYFLASRVVQPIKHLVLASKRIAGGDLGHRVRLKAKDEIRDLGDAFNFMAASLNERDEQLKEQATQTIMKSERLATIGQLAAGVAHEINNPLGGILSYSHLVLEDTDTEDPRKQNLEKIVIQATRCREIVKGLLDFARQTEPEMSLGDINDMLREALALVEKQAQFHNIEVIKHIDPNPIQVMVDPSQIQQVLINIIMNAAESMAGRGELVLETKKTDGDQALVKITDTGTGIPEDNIEKLFDPFFTTKEVGSGTGLGLAVSYGIVERHKGSIEVSSEVGLGTTFIISLPLYKG
ncbi:MAG: cache domain-containing protein [Fidelibacterota bacterium]|nr:MAG: cache domain-containing protein [Candidatus Neomarinimicrobiota bacterium]